MTMTATAQEVIPMRTTALEFAETEPLPPRVGRPGLPCRITDCPGLTYARGWCMRHYTLWRRHGSPLINTRPNWGSGREVTPAGYVSLHLPEHPLANGSGRVFEHRVVAWDAGLLTDPEKDVHHKNEIKDDNRLENLEVLTRAEHIARHRGEVDADEIVFLYSIGLHMKEIAAKLGYSSATVHKRLVAAGVPRRPWGGR